MKPQTAPLILIFILIPLPALSQTTAALDWFRIYDGPSHGIDIGTAACIDLASNFYVAGRSHNVSSGPDFVVLKFSPAGDQLLDLRIDGGSAGWDEPTALSANDDGFVVTGNSSLSSGVSTVLTMKFDTVGTLVWRERYPADSSFSSSSVALGEDISGNVYIGATPYFTVVKYSSDGVLLWERSYRSDSGEVQGLTALAVSPEGNVYATGVVSEECPEGLCRYDMTTLKYDTDGNIQWINAFTVSDETNEQPAAMVLDADENVLIVANAWDGMTGENSLILKYSSLGDLEWSRTYDGTVSYDNPVGIATDAGGNVVIAGTTWTTGPFNYSLVKFDPNGNQLWSLEYDHASGTRDFAFGLSLDSSGNIYLTGSSRVGIIGLDTCVTIKVDPQGSLVWATSFSRPDGGTIYGREVFVHNNGDVSILADGAGPVNGLDFHALRYVQIPVGVGTTNEVHSGEPLLHQNYPNPFNPTTAIWFSTPIAGDVSLEVFNLLGEQVATLSSGAMDAGTHSVQWDATGQPSGVYFYRLQAGSYVKTRKLVLLR